MQKALSPVLHVEKLEPVNPSTANPAPSYLKSPDRDACRSLLCTTLWRIVLGCHGYEGEMN